MHTDLSYVSRKKAKGKTYLYYARAGLRLPLPNPEGSAAFLQKYDEYHAQFEDRHYSAGTVASAIEFYLADGKSSFTQVGERSRVDYRRVLDDMRREFGTIPVKLVTLAWVEEVRSHYLKIPGRWNTIRKRMRSVWETYRKYYPGVITEDPWKDAGSLPAPRSDQNRIWPDQVLLRVLSAATPEFRLLLVVLLLTSQRIGDAVSLLITAYDPKERTLVFTQEKTDKSMVLHVPKVIAKLLATWPADRSMLLLTPSGRRWTVQNAEETLLSLRANLGLPRYTLHGLRATGPTAAKMMGLENRSIRSLTGHTSDQNLEVYLKGAEQFTLAKKVQSAIENRYGNVVERAVATGNRKKVSGITGKAAARAGVVGNARKVRGSPVEG